jgi:hypothetical protein
VVVVGVAVGGTGVLVGTIVAVGEDPVRVKVLWASVVPPTTALTVWLPTGALGTVNFELKVADPVTVNEVKSDRQ